MNIRTWTERIVTANPPYVDPEEINKAMLEEIDELRADAARYREALKSRIEVDMQSWYKLHYLMKKHGWHPGRTDDDLIDVLDGKLEELRAKLAALEVMYLNSLADATQWQLYKSRKDAVIAAGMGRKAMRDSAAGAAPVPNAELAEALEDLMIWQVKNVKRWHNSAYDNAARVLKKLEAGAAPAAKVPEEQTP